MKKFRDILVYAEIDDADCIARVVRLARAHGAAITLCEVVEPPPRTKDGRGVVERVSKLLAARASRRLRTLCEQFANEILDFSVFSGEHYLAITQQVVAQNYDLVVHISEPLHEGTGTGLNATGMHLMRKCPCTVWALHPARSPDRSDVVLALDREVAAETTVADAFAMTLAESAVSLAMAGGGQLHLVHAWRPYGHELLDDPELRLTIEEQDLYRRQQRKDTELWFRRITQRIESIAPEELAVHTRLMEGPSASSVLATLEEAGAGTLVLGTVGTSANPGVLIGLTTESILAACDTSVLVLKPPGFVSPLARGFQD
ncbi:MAG: universal stress protein [Chromatocurvus sp.]